MGEEDRRGGAEPLGIGWGKVRADIALADGAQDGIGQRVQYRIGIRVPAQLGVVRYPDPTQDDAVACFEGVDVEPLPDPNVRAALEIVARQRPLRSGDVAG